jgi:hypothetical protein
MLLYSALVPHLIIGLAVGAGFYGMFMLACGFFVKASNIVRLLPIMMAALLLTSLSAPTAGLVDLAALHLLPQVCLRGSDSSISSEVTIVVHVVWSGLICMHGVVVGADLHV